MYHCAAGKDRTGIMTALLLTMLGVDRDTVMADYALSDEVSASTKPENMAELLDEVQSQGGIECYLAGIGVTIETQGAIRDLLLEPAESGDLP
jgi:protein-tyrosine phosphatase